MKEIELSNGMKCKVDDDDFDKLSKYNWHLVASRHNSHKYAKKYVLRNGVQTSDRMHRLIMNCPDGLLVDPKDHDGLNNQKSNLRIATHAENQRNQKAYPGRSSKFKGVTKDSRSNRLWIARISVNNKQIGLGYFELEEDAAKAYDKASLLYHGDFGFRNFGP